MRRTAFRSRTTFKANFLEMTDRVVFEETKVLIDANKQSDRLSCFFSTVKVNCETEPVTIQKLSDK